MGQYDALFTPLKLRHLTIRNRIMSTAHAPSYARDAMPAERYQRYHEEKAIGGVGLTMFGGSSSVSVDSPATFGQLNLATDAVLPYLSEFSARIHRHGAKIMCQITHMGRRTRWDTGDWLPTISASRVREPEHRSYPKAMEIEDIARVTADFAAAARRCRDGGLDGCELSYAGFHLIPQFWSPVTNKREDAYGGSPENRMRLGFEVLGAIRAAVGSNFILGVRISGDELIEGGLSQPDMIDIARALASSGLIDFLSVVGGQPSSLSSLSAHMPNMAYPVAPFLYLASAIKAEIDIPIFHATRITDVATAARAVGEGHVDLVAMTRALIADPHIPRKLSEGRIDEIRQCVGAAYCIDRIYAHGEALCIQNPATSREATMPHRIPKADATRTIVVVGAGPAGLEAARVGAERGHKIVLFEMAPRPGGQVALAAKATWRENLSGIIRWLDSEVRRLGVDLRLGVEADQQRVLAENPDVVVLATGGEPDKGDFPGAELAQSTWDILSGRVAPAGNVLLYDDHGDHQAPSAAEVMAKAGALVEIVVPDRMVGIEIGATNIGVHLRELAKLGVILTPGFRLVSLAAEGNRLVAVLRHEFSRQEEERLIDQVVSEHGTRPRDSLYFQLKPLSRNLGQVDLDALIAGRRQALAANPAGRFQLFRVGDAVAGRNIHAAIYDSLRLCKDL